MSRMNLRLDELPYEIIEIITDNISSPSDFRNWALTCVLFSIIANRVSSKKLMDFAKEVRINVDNRHIHEYCVLPNGDKIGEHKIWLYPLDHEDNPEILPVLVSHTWISPFGSEVKAYWTSGNRRLFQDWFHYPVNKLMTEHKTFCPAGKLKDIKYSITFSTDLKLDDESGE